MVKDYTWRISAKVGLLGMCLLWLPELLSAQVSWNMNLLGNWDDASIPAVSGGQYNDVVGYEAGGREYAIIGATTANYVIEVTNAATPVVRAILNSGCTSTRWRDQAIYQNYLYVVSDNCAGGGLQVWNLNTLPAAPTLVFNSTTFFSTAHTIFVNPGSARLYVAGCNTQSTGIKILSLANPAAPTQMASFNLGTYTHDIYVHNDTLYAFYGNNGLACFDFVSLAAPAQLEYFYSYPDWGYAHSGCGIANNKYLVWTDETVGRNVKVGDISDPRNMSFTTMFKSALLGPTYMNSIAHNAVAVGNLVYISYYEDGIQIYDFTTPSAPVKTAYYDTQNNSVYNGMVGAWGVTPPLSSGKILVSDIQNGLFILQHVPPLPVNWSDFTVVAMQDRVKLDWTTQTETNNVGFVVERSADGVTFEPLQQLPGAGTSNEPRSYSTYDLNPLPGISYYKVRQLDANGGSSTSKIVSVDFSNALPDWSAYPSPAHVGENVNLQINVQEHVRGTLAVFDMVGKQLHSVTLDLSPGQVEMALPSADWSAGSYLMRLDAGTYHLERKLLLTN
jgi:choice-of-anchor B domain-containing protein